MSYRIIPRDPEAYYTQSATQLALTNIKKVGARIPYNLSITHFTGYTYRGRRREDSVSIFIGKGRGDQAVTCFYKESSDPDLYALLKFYARILTPDLNNLAPIIDKLQELDHWITPLLKRWFDMASIPEPEPKRKPKPKVDVFA